MLQLDLSNKYYTNLRIITYLLKKKYDTNLSIKKYYANLSIKKKISYELLRIYLLKKILYEFLY